MGDQTQAQPSQPYIGATPILCLTIEQLHIIMLDSRTEEVGFGHSSIISGHRDREKTQILVAAEN